MADVCTTFDCEQPSVALVRIEDEGWHRYCVDCAESLERGGDEVKWVPLVAERDRFKTRLSALQSALEEEIAKSKAIATNWRWNGHIRGAHASLADRLQQILDRSREED